MEDRKGGGGSPGQGWRWGSFSGLRKSLEVILRVGSRGDEIGEKTPMIY